MAELCPPTRRVREDYLPTWGMFGGVTVLTMEPYAYPPARDLIFFPDQGNMSKPQWGLLADLANRLQARTHILRAATAHEAAPAYAELVISWFERPGEIVVAGVGSGAELTSFFEAGLFEPGLFEPSFEPGQPGVPAPDFVIPLPAYMLRPFSPRTTEKLRQISDLVWGENDETAQ